MKIAVFFANKSHEGRDISKIEDGNPGMGATDYLFFLMGHMLSLRDNGISVTMMLTHPMTCAPGVRQELVSSMTDAFNQCRAEAIDYMVIKHANFYVEEIKRMPITDGTRLIVWCENFASPSEWTFYASCPLVAKLITVSREQADAYRDHKAFLKTDWIHNCVIVPKEYLKDVPPPTSRKPVVTYIGAIIQGKGFHLLARAWPKVLQAVPNAELYVIGSGALYGGKIEFGKWNLAEKSYEDSFMGYLTDGDKLLPGVHLMGIMGNEKFDVLRQTKVGVPNPSGLTETFCNSGVEMQLMGAVIASRKCIAYMDTVINGTLVDDPNQLADAIVKELRSTDDAYDKTRQYIEEHFSSEVFATQWERLFNEVIPRGIKLHDDLPLVNPDFEGKKWKERMRKLKMRHTWLYSVLPSVGTGVEYWKILSWAVWKRMNL